MTDYFILVAGVLCALVALFCFLLFTLGSFNVHEVETSSINDELENPKNAMKWFVIISGAGVMLFGALGLWSYQYLRARDPSVLDFFAVWYLVGFASRLLILIKRHQILSPVFATEWSSVFAAFFWALFGPLMTIQLFRVLLFEKNFWEK